jgi:aspartyl-tRNA(Asn)/glutamyl-tRNA(Gln) amidotransferase subunit A
MLDNDLITLTVHQTAAALRAGETTAVDLAQAHLERIEALDDQFSAYLVVTGEQALEQARRADERLAAGEDDPLLGIPLAYKDNLCTKGVQTTCGSRILEGYRPPYDATVIDRLAGRGAVMLGKTNMDEFAMGSSTENSAFFQTRNPWDTARVPGGSSGGSAAAVASGMAVGALGSDTGGSIRQPGSLTGIVALKPTYGRVSRYGLVAFASSLDQIGPFARCVADVAVLMGAIAGHDPLDSTSANLPVPDYLAALAGDVKGLRIGVPKEYFIEGIQPSVEQAVRGAIDKLQELGAEIHQISLPHTDAALPTYYLIAPAEASANLARYDGVRYGLRKPAGEMWETYMQSRGAGFGPEVKRRIMLGTYALSAGYYDAYYVKAQKVRTLIRQDFDRAFEKVDVVACPTSPTTAFLLGERTDDPMQMYLADVFTLAVNLAGICGLSLPCGFDADNLPIGLQLIGPAFGEETILRAAHAYEQATTWHTCHPTVPQQ